MSDLVEKKIDKFCHETNTFVFHDNESCGSGVSRRLKELEQMLDLGYKVDLESISISWGWTILLIDYFIH